MFLVHLIGSRGVSCNGQAYRWQLYSSFLSSFHKESLLKCPMNLTKNDEEIVWLIALHMI